MREGGREYEDKKKDHKRPGCVLGNLFQIIQGTILIFGTEKPFFCPRSISAGSPAVRPAKRSNVHALHLCYECYVFFLKTWLY